MRTKEQMMDLIVGIARDDERVRAVCNTPHVRRRCFFHN